MPTPEQIDQVFYYAREHLNNSYTSRVMTDVDAVSLSMRYNIGPSIWRLSNSPHFKRGRTLRELAQKFGPFEGTGDWKATSMSLILMGNIGEYLHRSIEFYEYGDRRFLVDPLAVFLTRLQTNLQSTNVPFDDRRYHRFIIQEGLVEAASAKNERQRLMMRFKSEGHLKSLYRRGTLLSETPAFQVVRQYLSDHRLEREVSQDLLNDHGILFEEALLALRRGSKTRSEYFEEFESEGTLEKVLNKWRDPGFRH